MANRTWIAAITSDLANYVGLSATTEKWRQEWREIKGGRKLLLASCLLVGILASYLTYYVLEAKHAEHFKSLTEDSNSRLISRDRILTKADQTTALLHQEIGSLRSAVAKLEGQVTDQRNLLQTKQGEIEDLNRELALQIKSVRAAPEVSVTSNNQSGGITANTVNVGSNPRRITRDLEDQVMQMTAGYKRITVTAVLGDGEALQFADSIFRFLKAKGRNVEGVNQAVYMQPVVGQIAEADGDTINLIIGTKQ